MGQSPKYRGRQDTLDRVEALARDILTREECFSLKSLAVNGRDLIDAGFSAGPSLGKILDSLLEQVMDGKIENKKDVLIEAAKSSVTK